MQPVAVPPSDVARPVFAPIENAVIALPLGNHAKTRWPWTCRVEIRGSACVVAFTRTGERLVGTLARRLDEFALWLNLQDVYWAKEGRQSLDAVVLVVALLGAYLVAERFWRAATREVVETLRELTSARSRPPRD